MRDGGSDRPEGVSSNPALNRPITPDEMVARARALRPLVRADAPDAEKRGRYSESLHEEFKRAGFFRILQPRKFGGLELDVPTFYRVMVEICTGDPGIGWCLCLGAGHALQVASYFDEKAQDEIFGPERHFVSPLSASGTGPNCKAVREGDEYVVSGTWRYCSGSPYSTHFMGLARVSGDSSGPAQVVLVVVPRAQYRVLDDWGDILGLRASGSNSIEIQGARIPENYVCDVKYMENIVGQTPGFAIHGNPMYAGPMIGFAGGELVCSQVGAAKAALEEYERVIRMTSPRFDRSVRKYQHHDWQRVFGLAMPTTLAAEALLIHTGDLYMQYCRDGVEGRHDFGLARGLTLLGLQHQAARLAWEAGVDLFRASSSTSAKDGELMQRLFRDLATFKNNASHQPDFTAKEIAQAYFGLPASRDY